MRTDVGGGVDEAYAQIGLWKFRTITDESVRGTHETMFDFSLKVH